MEERAVVLQHITELEVGAGCKHGPVSCDQGAAAWSLGGHGHGAWDRPVGVVCLHLSLPPVQRAAQEARALAQMRRVCGRVASERDVACYFSKWRHNAVAGGAAMRQCHEAVHVTDTD